MSADWMDEPLDLNQDEEYEPIEDGLYRATVQEVEAKENANGKPQLIWRFRLAEGPDEGRIVFDSTYLHEDALWTTKEVVNAIDMYRDWEGVSPRTVVSDCTGEDLRIEVAQGPQDDYANVLNHLPTEEDLQKQEDEEGEDVVDTSANEEQEEEEEIPF